ncbi:hypothetical protein [Paraburkholderia lacunae]|uniref:Uncharacterized protein n=1 Tax=Paraburkholderia lacunae TaxID=2211104 RepID=A0A370NCU3_9BURK|nr:hypothetical protein [Paraburkholderia lacunae]RDK03358.1 hypothetical protein DLM46_07440 [Paraburkholderia lacunae]
MNIFKIARDECFVNSAHIEDCDDKALLSLAIQFVLRVFSAWRALTPTLILIFIVSVDEFSVVVKFHAKRPTKQWLSESMEGYEDPTMSVESSEDLTLAFAALRGR